MKNKGQSAVEFMILLSTMFFIFVSFISVVYTNLEQKNYEKKDIALKEIASSLQDEIQLAYEASDGYSREFELPETSLYDYYEIMIDGEVLYIVTHDNRHAMTLPVYNVIGQPLKTGTNKIMNDKGVLYLNTVPGEAVFRLTVNRANSGANGVSGTVVKTVSGSSGINCIDGGDCYHDYSSGTIVKLSSYGYGNIAVNDLAPFLNCNSMTYSNSVGSCTVIMSSDKTVTANFKDI